MSWLISLILAGVVFSNDATVPARQNSFSNTETTTTKIISLDETERFEQTYPLNSNGRVSLSNVNGSVTIDTWDRNEVKLEAVKTADDKERLSEVEIQIDARKDYLSVETNYDNWKRDSNRVWKNYGKLNVDYRLTVPRGAVLDEIETVNGSVTISNTTNITKASTVNGQVVATNLRGTANLSTVNGKVEANFDQLQSSSKISLNTVNGQVQLMIPSDANATVKADTVNGSINNDFGLPVRKGQYVGRDLYGKIGSGEVQIRLNSVNGGLFIKRKDDGKNVNPSVNLLPAKSEDDEDSIDIEDAPNVEAAVSVSKINKEINKSVKKSQAEAAVQMKNSQKDLERAQRELERIKPELAKINQAEIQAKIDEGLRRQRDVMARLSNVNFASAPLIEKKTDAFTVKGTPKVIVEAKNCSVSVRGWDKQEVQYSITRVSRTRDQKPLAYTADHSESEVKITVNSANDSDELNDLERVRVEVFVPKKSNLRIRTDREIRLENVSGDIDVTGEDEAINVRDANGKLTIAAINGKVRVIGFKGELTAKTADGDMSLEGDFSKITATTGDGDIVLTVPDDVSATINSNSESVLLDAIDKSKITTVNIGENEARWRIGSGKAIYDFTLGDGQIFVRTMSNLQAKL